MKFKEGKLIERRTACPSALLISLFMSATLAYASWKVLLTGEPFFEQCKLVAMFISGMGCSVLLFKE